MATKANPTVRVYTKAPWMQLQETGGIKQISGKRLAIPLVKKPGSRLGVQFGVKRTKKDLVMKSQKPQALGSKAFIIKGKKGDLLATRTAKVRGPSLTSCMALNPGRTSRPDLNLKRQLVRW